MVIGHEFEYSWNCDFHFNHRSVCQLIPVLRRHSMCIMRAYVRTRSLWFLFLFLHKKQDAAQMTALYATPCCCVGGWRYNYVYDALYLHYSHADSSLQQCQCPFLFATPPSWRLSYFSTPRAISFLLIFFFFSSSLNHGFGNTLILLWIKE